MATSDIKKGPLYVDSTNNRVGIGTSSPATALHINEGSANQIRLQRSGYDTIDIALSQNGLRFRNDTDGRNDLFLDGAGNVGIGTTASVDNSKLHVVQSGNKAGIAITGSSVGGSAHIRNATDQNTMTAHVFLTNTSTQAGYIACSGSTTNYVTSSDYRIKENVTNITGATDRLKQLNPVRFNFIGDADTTVDGFLAHEVQSVVPEAITGTKDGMRDEEYEVTPAVLDDDGNVVTEAVMGTRSVPAYQGIDQSKLVPLLVATIQELEARIAALESA